MKTFLRTSLFVLVGLCLFSAGSSLGQKKQDKIMTKANKMLQGYQPPKQLNLPETETPEQAWKSAYTKQHQSKTKRLAGSGSQPAVPTTNQYHKKGLSEQIRKQLAEASTPLTPADMKKRLEDQIKEDARLNKVPTSPRGRYPAVNPTREEMKQLLEASIQKDELAGKTPAAKLAKRGLKLPSQLSADDMRKEFIARAQQDDAKKGMTPGKSSPEDLKRQAEAQIEKDRLAKTGQFSKEKKVANSQYIYIQGTVWNDVNHDGVQDSAETGISGFTVYMYEYYRGRTLSTTTDSLGNYSFVDSVTDYYDPYINSVAGWYTTSNGGGYRYLVQGDTISANFGEWQIVPRSISGTVFNDLNHNGVRDSLEPPLAGWTINLYEYNGYKTYTTTSDSNGHYEFDSLMLVSAYEVYETHQFDWLGTVPSSYYYFTLYYDSVTAQDFGNWHMPPVSIQGMKFNDANGNGIKDSGEVGIPGWTINFYRSATGTWFSVQTDSNGMYAFTDSGYACYYEVTEQNQADWLTTFPYRSQSAYYDYYLAGDTITGQNFGNWHMPPIMITGTIFNDLNDNGQRDAGEPGLPGWTINILRSATGTWFQVQTDSNGMYAFTDSGYASYYEAVEVNQAGWLETRPWRSQSAYYDQYLAGDTATGWDFGNWFVSPSSIQGTVFNDLNDNGSDDSEPGLAGWTIHAINQDTQDTLTTVTDSLGNYAFYNLSWVHYYRVYEDPQLDWVNTYPAGGYWQPYVGGDTVGSINFGNYLPQPGPIRVDAMPSSTVSSTYANALAGVPLAVWGNVHGGLVPLHYTLDYGDGNIDSGIVTNRRFIGSMHTYSTAGPKTMTLTVVDANSNVGTNESVVKVYAASSTQILTNMAIEKGLLFLYLNQYPDGHWADNSNPIASTGGALLSFEENGHKPSNNIAVDIYAEYVRSGLNYLFSAAYKHPISVQPAGNPDANGNGYGAYFYDESYPNGLGMLAVIGAYSNPDSAKLDTIPVGSYTGTNFYDFIVDGMDEWAYSQTDSGYSGRGGWRYGVSTANSGDADNSTTQWATLNLEAAQNSWGIAIPQFVKNELIYWLQYSQDASGGFGYTGPNYWDNITKTAAGIGSYAFLGYTTDSIPVANAINFINGQWNVTTDVDGWAEPLTGNTYAMYGVAKGMRLINHRAGNQLIGAHDWYAEYVDHLLNDPTYGQNADGSWPRQLECSNRLYGRSIEFFSRHSRADQRSRGATPGRSDRAHRCSSA